MLQDSVSPNNEDVKSELLDLIREKKISSIQTMSSMIEKDHEDTLQILSELIEEGSLEGTIDENGRRFFNSSVKVSDAPVLSKHVEPEEPATRKTTKGKLGIIAGIGLIIVGEVIPREFLATYMLENLKIGLVFLGMAAFVGGLLYLSRSETPS